MVISSHKLNEYQSVELEGLTLEIGKQLKIQTHYSKVFCFGER